MKKYLVLTVLCCLLTGCAAEETFETIADELLQDAASPSWEILITLPQEAVVPVAQTETGALYHCDGYELMLQTLPGGDLDATVRELTGYGREHVTMLKTNPGDYRRWDLVWTSMGEGGEQVGRASVLDDGCNHYVLSVLADAEEADRCRDSWEMVFGSFALG